MQYEFCSSKGTLFFNATGLANKSGSCSWFISTVILQVNEKRLAANWLGYDMGSSSGKAQFVDVRMRPVTNPDQEITSITIESCRGV